MMAVFLSVSQWMMPSVLGFNSPARAKATSMFQSCRWRRFCHAHSFSATKPSACKVRCRAVIEGGGTVWAQEAIVKERKTPRRKRERWRGGILPNMCSMIPDFTGDRISFHLGFRLGFHLGSEASAGWRPGPDIARLGGPILGCRGW